LFSSTVVLAVAADNSPAEQLHHFCLISLVTSVFLFTN